MSTLVGSKYQPARQVITSHPRRWRGKEACCLLMLGNLSLMQEHHVIGKASCLPLIVGYQQQFRTTATDVLDQGLYS